MHIVKHMNNDSGNQDTIEKTVKMKYVDLDKPRASDIDEKIRKETTPLMPLIEGPQKLRKSNSVNKMGTMQQTTSIKRSMTSTHIK